MFQDYLEYSHNNMNAFTGSKVFKTWLLRSSPENLSSLMILGHLNSPIQIAFPSSKAKTI